MTPSEEESDSKITLLKKRNTDWHPNYEAGHNLALSQKHSSSKVKRSVDYGYGANWQYPSNLMVLLRGHGKRGLPITTDLLDMADSLNVPDAYARKRFSAYPRDYSRGSAPVSSRQFMIWKNGNYILG